MANSVTRAEPGREQLESDQEDDDLEELTEQLEKVEIDAARLTPLSPEVISKQVSVTRRKKYSC